MPYNVFISPSALRDLDAAIDYYNEKALDLGYRFAGLVNEYLHRIALVPTASAVKYKNVRCKPMITFPYIIMYTIDEQKSTINVLRIFNTWQEPFW